MLTSFLVTCEGWIEKIPTFLLLADTYRNCRQYCQCNPHHPGKRNGPDPASTAAVLPATQFRFIFTISVEPMRTPKFHNLPAACAHLLKADLNPLYKEKALVKPEFLPFYQSGGVSHPP
jgi:hypothetical protein